MKITRWLLLILLMSLVTNWNLASSEPTPSPERGIPCNWDRDGFVNEKDGSVLVTVPAGEFYYGAAPKDKQAEVNEKPRRRLRLSSFQISRYEVTNAQYARFVKATSYISAENDRWKRCPESSSDPRAPVAYVAWKDAQAYCQWAGLRLPTEEEWERAARGTDGRIYPWGNSWDDLQRVAQGIQPVGSHTSGKSPTGCLDMAGNVWEWTSSNYELTGDKSIRGGSSGSYPTNYRTSYRNATAPNSPHVLLGFRCARTP